MEYRPSERKRQRLLGRLPCTHVGGSGGRLSDLCNITRSPLGLGRTTRLGVFAHQLAGVGTRRGSEGEAESGVPDSEHCGSRGRAVCRPWRTGSWSDDGARLPRRGHQGCPAHPHLRHDRNRVQIHDGHHSVCAPRGNPAAPRTSVRGVVYGPCASKGQPDPRRRGGSLLPRARRPLRLRFGQEGGRKNRRPCRYQHARVRYPRVAAYWVIPVALAVLAFVLVAQAFGGSGKADPHPHVPADTGTNAQ